MEAVRECGVEMITRRQLREMHGSGLPLHILEQDYVQSLLLQELYSSDDSLVFKGGTYMKHAFGLDRFSEDLDFTLSGGKYDGSVLVSASSHLSKYGIRSEIERIEDDEISWNAALRYRGPLFDGSENSVGTIRLEVSKRRDVFMEPEWTRLFFKYPESPVINVLGLAKNGVLAEKLRALSTRSKGRDLYDVWFLLKQGVGPDRDIFKRKMAVMDRDAIVQINISEREYNDDLKILLMRPPLYSKVLEEVRSIMKRNGWDLEYDPGKK
jgi:predicted nucleotidyltransferase component of viral defense system